MGVSQYPCCPESQECADEEYRDIRRRHISPEDSGICVEKDRNTQRARKISRHICSGQRRMRFSELFLHK